MVNTGKASHGCAVCRQRRIKCDLVRPACSQCVKAGWDCPGPRIQTDVIFRDQTALVRRKAGGVTATNSDTDNSAPQSPGFIRSVSPATSDRGTAFFLHQYSFQGNCVFNVAKPRGLHEYLPTLLRNEPLDGSLRTMVTAAGLAALSNTGNAQTWTAEAYRLYNQAIRQLQHVLSAPVRACNDGTLAAVMLMSTFESIVSGDVDSMKIYGEHTMAAGQLIGLRGPAQFHGDEPLKIFLELRRTTFMTCHQLQISIPSAIDLWARWAAAALQADELCSNAFAEINVRLSNIRADIKAQGVTSPDAIISALLPIGKQLNHWQQTVPRSWYIEKLHIKEQNDASTQIWQSRYDLYEDFWKATVWNGFRAVKMVIHEGIIRSIVTSQVTEHHEQLRLSIAALKETVDDVCASVPYLLGHYRRVESGNTTKNSGNHQPETNPIPGGWVLVWPLFQAAMMRTTSRLQREYIAGVLKHIGLTMGLRLAKSMAEFIAKNDTILADGDSWLTGEFTTLR